MAYTKNNWTNDGGIPINAANLNKMETGIYNADNVANETKDAFDTFKATGDFKTLQTKVNTMSTTLDSTAGKVDAIGTVRGFNGSSSVSDKNASASTAIDLGNATLSAGTWVVCARARFTPSASGNHYSSIAINTSSGSSVYMDRRFGSGDISLQHSMTAILELSASTVVYLAANQNVAGTWVKSSSAAYSLRAVRIA